VFEYTSEIPSMRSLLSTDDTALTGIRLASRASIDWSRSRAKKGGPNNDSDGPGVASMTGLGADLADLDRPVGRWRVKKLKRASAERRSADEEQWSDKNTSDAISSLVESKRTSKQRDDPCAWAQDPTIVEESQRVAADEVYSK
jgi:hypothetical protein